MSDPIDQLLAQLQASGGATQPANPVKPPSQHSSMSSQPASGSSQSIDDLLAEVEGQPQPPRSVQPAAAPTFSSSPSPTFPSPVPAARDASLDHLLSDMQSLYQAQDQAEEQRRQQQLQEEQRQQALQALKQQQQLQEEQRRQAVLQRQRQAAVIKQAEAWLKTLDPRGGEGAWFEEFAVKYSSRVEAAIEYLGLQP